MLEVASTPNDLVVGGEVLRDKGIGIATPCVSTDYGVLVGASCTAFAIN